MKTKQILYAFLKSNFLFFTLFLLLLVSRCKKETTSGFITKFSNGVFVVNEGSYDNTPGGISYFSKSTELIDGNLFEEVNGVPLGDVVQSMSVNGDTTAYIVVNNSNKIEVVSLTNFKSIGTITGLAQPRYFLGINSNKGYVSQWGIDGKTGSIQIINLATNKISDSIATPAGPDQMLKVGDNIFVTCNGGYSKENKVIVINTTTNAITKTITVGDIPSYIQQDKTEKIWVLCKGKYKADWSGLETAGQLVKIHPATFAVEQRLSFPIDQSPSLLATNAGKDKIYYSYQNNIYVLDITATSLNISTPLISRSKGFYGIGVDITNNNIYGAYAPNFSSNGWVLRYKNDGTIIDSFRTGGIGPNSFVFQ